jgi:hypothetical protein
VAVSAAITTERERRLRYFMEAHCIDSHKVKTRAQPRNYERAAKNARSDGTRSAHPWTGFPEGVKMAMSLRRRIASVLLLVGLGPTIQCGSPDAPSRAEATFQVRACRGSRRAPEGEVFRILLRDSASIAQARNLIGAGNRRIVAGTLASGNGGFNAPWSWHLNPDTVSFPEVTVEICDGCPSDVEMNGGNWGLGSFCPWTSEVIAEQH